MTGYFLFVGDNVVLVEGLLLGASGIDGEPDGENSLGMVFILGCMDGNSEGDFIGLFVGNAVGFVTLNNIKTISFGFDNENKTFITAFNLLVLWDF